MLFLLFPRIKYFARFISKNFVPISRSKILSFSWSGFKISSFFFCSIHSIMEATSKQAFGSSGKRTDSTAPEDEAQSKNPNFPHLSNKGTAFLLPSTFIIVMDVTSNKNAGKAPILTEEAIPEDEVAMVNLKEKRRLEPATMRSMGGFGLQPCRGL